MTVPDFYKCGLPVQVMYKDDQFTAYRTKKGQIQIGTASSRFWVDPKDLKKLFGGKP